MSETKKKPSEARKKSSEAKIKASDAVSYTQLVSLAKELDVPVYAEEECSINLEALGAGASMTVHGGTCRIGDDKVEVAFKFTRQSILESTKERHVINALTVILQEVRLMAHLEHPNIINFYGIVFRNLNPGLIVELALGTLAEFLDSQQFDWSAKERFCYEIGGALEAIHQSGIIFGDLKCDNILLFKNANGDFVSKINDFGYSSVYASHPGHFIGGTWEFEAPEYHDPVLEDFKCKEPGDIYSYGVVVWQIARDGEVPFLQLNRSWDELQNLRSEKPNYLLDELAPDTPEVFKKVISRATSYHPADRPALTELLSEFKNLLQLEDEYKNTKTTFELKAKKPIAKAEPAKISSLRELSIPALLEKRLFEEYKKAAENEGNFTAKLHLAICYHYGFGTTKDDVKAVEYCTEAANEGYTIAEYNLGWFLSNGVGIAKDEVKAEEWFHKAAKAGHAEAQIYIGNLIWGPEKNTDVQEKFEKAKEWFLKAADTPNGHELAEFNLGQIHEFINDFQTAVEWYEKAHLKGSIDAKLRLVHIFQYEPSMIDYERAMKYAQAEAGGRVEGSARGRLSLARARLSYAMGDHASAATFFGEADEVLPANEDPHRQFEMGVFYYEIKDFEKSEKQFRLSLNKGVGSEFWLGHLYFAQKNFAKSQEWFLKARGVSLPGDPDNRVKINKKIKKLANSGDADAQASIFRRDPGQAEKRLSKVTKLDASVAFAIGVYYELRSRKTLSKSMRFYKKAAENGCEVAESHLECLNELTNKSTKCPAQDKEPCKREFKHMEEAYLCYTCGGNDEVLCLPCFHATKHDGHKVVMYFEQGAGGSCDCGNRELWKKKKFCPNHSSEVNRRWIWYPVKLYNHCKNGSRV